MRTARMRAVLSVLLMSSAAPSALANLPTAPSAKPMIQPVSAVVSTTDAALMRQIVDAAESARWDRLPVLESQANDPVLKNIALWYRVTNDRSLSFDELDRALQRLEGWPSLTSVKYRAEDSIRDSAVSFEDRIAWFEREGEPVTGGGRLALAEAYRATGNPDKALDYARQAWRGNTLNSAETALLQSQFGSAFTAEDNQARADFLLWTDQRSAAQQLKPQLSSGWQRLVDARIKLQARAAGVDAAVDAVPSSLQNDPGLMFDRAVWRRRAGLGTDTYLPLLRQIDGSLISESGRDDLWDARAGHVRDALKARDWQLAYDLSAPHGMSSGGDFAEAEWLAGWVALRFLDMPERAAQHFKFMGENVSTPISRGRALYWEGRALEAMGDETGAAEAYGRAAEYNYVYYGQLAAEKIGETTIEFADAGEPTPAELTDFEARPLVRAMRLFAETGETWQFRLFAYHLDDQLGSVADYTLLSQIAQEYQFDDVGVRGAKAGMAKGIVSPDAAYPLVNYDLMREPRVERAKMLALARQESEMNTRAVSHAGARGLMQFMPATAQYEARLNGLPYELSWLTDDPGYNMTLGGAHLDNLLGQFNGSYIMTAAAYNAGASRPQRWVTEYGDPRAGEIDPIDWVELVPFSETRNYIQRVLENTQVYRHRLTGEPAEIRISEDLQRGRF